MSKGKMFAAYSFFNQLPNENIDVHEENKRL